MFIRTDNIGLSLDAVKGQVALTASIENSGVVELCRNRPLILFNIV